MTVQGQEPQKRSFLTVTQKHRVLEALSNDLSYSQVMAMVDFKVSKGQISSIFKNRDRIEHQFQSSAFLTRKRYASPKFPNVEAEVLQLVTWLRAERMPVSMSIITQQGLLSAEKNHVSEFKASRCWVEKFLRRNGIQPSVRLRGKAGDVVRADHQAAMQTIRDTMTRYKIANIYNEDESGLLYRTLPSRAYLSQTESRSGVRGTSQMRRQDRITTVYCTNATGSHKLPMQFIGRASLPRCMRIRRDLTPRYSAQSNAWTDSALFKKWVTFWYEEVKKVSDGPWLLLLDNCAGHHDLPLLNGVAYAFLPPNTTVMFQRLDQGLIAACKKNYRESFLRRAVEAMQHCLADNPFPTNVDAGRGGIREGRLSDIADAIDMLDSVWSSTDPTTVMRCWIKADCLPIDLVNDLRSRLTDVNGSCVVGDALTIGNVEGTVANFTSLNLSTVPSTPIGDLTGDVIEDGAQSAIAAIDEDILGEVRLQNFMSDIQLIDLFSQNQIAECEAGQENIPPLAAVDPITPYTAAIDTLQTVLESANVAQDRELLRLIGSTITSAGQLRESKRNSDAA